MSLSPPTSEESEVYQNDHRLIQAYREATNLDPEGLEALCPSYVELSETETRYQDQELLGKGGVKEVYRAFDNRTRRWIAMAQLRSDRGQEFYDLFVNEAWLTSSLNHPNIISIHNVGIGEEGRPFFTMDLKGNTTLAKLISNGDQERNTLLRVFLKICDAMAYAHSQDIIHLDLKPENIQTDSFGEVLVCDWGLGKIVSDDEDEVTSTSTVELLDNMTLIGEVKGSPGYMAPEQIESDGHKDHRTDIFSLGCILHTILTGKPPFTGNRKAILKATSRGDVADPSERYPDLRIPPSLGAVTMKALAKNPDERYQSVSELKDDVLRYLEGFSTNAEESSFLREAVLFASRNRTPVIITSLSIIVLTVLSTLFIQKLDFLQQSIDEESQLAEQYAHEAEAATDKYHETVSKSKEEQIALARSLLTSVKGLKNRGIFDTPMKSIRQGLSLADHALVLDPDSEGVKYELFALNFICLNFKEALKYPLPKGHGRYGYMTLANAFPEFDYHRTKRPDTAKLSSFLSQAREIDPNHSAIIERIISYDAALRGSRDSYHPAILEFIKYLNPDTPDIELSKNPQEPEVILSTKESIRLIADPGGSEECVLRYLQLRSLKIASSAEFDLSQLNGLTIRRLDLSTCPNFTVSKQVSLPFLERLIINPETSSSGELHHWIQGAKEFQIID